MSIGEFCNRQVVTATREETIIEAAKRMRQHHVGTVVVVDSSGDETVPVGIVTDRDIVMQLVAGDVDLNAVTVGDVMSYELVTAGEQDGIGDILKRMRVHGVRRLPVVNRRGGLAGILTVDDLLELIAGELQALAEVVTIQQQLEKAVRK